MPSNAQKQETEGVSPKVPAQAVSTVLTFILAKYGIDLDTETSGAVAVIIGSIGGALAGPGRVRPARA